MKEDLYDDFSNEKEEKTDFQAIFFKYIITGLGLWQVR